MDIINNVSDLNYQNWKKTIDQIILYKHFKKEVEETNLNIQKKMTQYQNIKNKTKQQNREYIELLNQIVFNCSSIYQKVEENLTNKQLLNQIYEQKNIDVSEEGYKRWLETGEKIKI